MPSGPYSFIEKTEARPGSSPRTSAIMPKQSDALNRSIRKRAFDSDCWSA